MPEIIERHASGVQTYSSPNMDYSQIAISDVHFFLNQTGKQHVTLSGFIIAMNLEAMNRQD